MSLSSSGAFCVLFNSISPVYLLPVLLSLYSVSAWLNLGVLLAFAVVSFAAGRVVVAMLERSALSTSLLSEAPKTEEEHTVPLVLFARSFCGDAWYTVTCALSLVAACSLSLLSLSLMAALYGEEWTAAIVLMVGGALSLLNLFSFAQTTSAHVFLAVCKLALCLSVQLSPGVFAAWGHPVLLLPTAFAFHLPLGEVLSAMKRKEEQVGLLEAVAGGVAAGCIILAQNISAYTFPWLSAVQSALLVLTAAISLQIHWKSLSNLLLVFRYDTDIARSRSAHPTAARALELTLHWPLFLYYIYSRTSPHIGLFTLAAFSHLVLCLALLYSYELRIIDYDQEFSVSPWWAPVAIKYLLEIGLLAWAIGLKLMGLEGPEEAWAVLPPSAVAVAVVAAIRVWRKVQSR